MKKPFKMKRWAIKSRQTGEIEKIGEEWNVKQDLIYMSGAGEKVVRVLVQEIPARRKNK